MPTYDYQCSTCDNRFELFQSFSEDALSRCPSRRSGNSPTTCVAPGKGKVLKIFSAPGISFKGSGFYKTDSRVSSNGSSGSSSNGNGTANGSTDKGSDAAPKADSSGSKGAEKSEKSERSETKDTSKPAQGKKDAKPAAATSS